MQQRPLRRCYCGGKGRKTLYARHCLPMSRPLLTLKPKAAPAEPAPSPKAQERRISPPRSAVRELAAVGLPLFQKKHKLGVIIPMKIGIYNDVLAVTDPTQRKAMKKLLNVVARSRAYQYALTSDGACGATCKATPSSR